MEQKPKRVDPTVCHVQIQGSASIERYRAVRDAMPNGMVHLDAYRRDGRLGYGGLYLASYVDRATLYDGMARLRDLGVNAVQLTPVPESDGDVTAGYNPVAQFAPKWKYGAPADFKYLVDQLHRNGIAVLMDIVWNHFSVNGNFLWQYDNSTQDWFESPDFSTPWGSQAAFGKSAVADYYVASAMHWLEEYHVDGFRMDATSAMNTGSHAASGWQLMQRFNQSIAQRYQGRITIAEQLPNDAAVTAPVSGGGAGFSAQYHMKFRDNVRGAVFAAASNSSDMTSVRDALLGSGPTIQGTSALNYVQLHDEAWNGSHRMTQLIDTTVPYDDIYARGRTRLAEGLVLTSQGMPAFLMGDEWLESIDFGADTPYRIDWSKKTTYATTFQFYKRLIDLRRHLPALRASSSTYVSRADNTNHVIAFRRMDGAGNAVMVVANFNTNALANVRIGVPLSGTWTELVNSQDPQYAGSGPVNGGALLADGSNPADGFNQSVVLQLPAMSLLILAPNAQVGVEAIAPPTGLALSAPTPNPMHGGTSLAFTLPTAGAVRLAVLDLQGRVVRTLLDERRAAGIHAARWDGRDADGRTTPAGLYFVRLTTPSGSRAVRVTRLD